jgi:hypothetical protein
MAGQTEYIDGVNRIVPSVPAAVMKTYSLVAPSETHRRPASCQDVDCQQWREGWVTALDESDPDQRDGANYIRLMVTRRFTEHRATRVPSIDGAGESTVVIDDTGPLTAFQFEAGQKCFGAHSMSLEREPLYVVRGGDFRGNPTGEWREHANGEDWVDDLATNLDANRTLRDNG